MKKIGIVGGTFDPIHNGHLMLGETAYREFHLDEIFFIPTGVPAYKELLHSISSKFHRESMTKLAIQEKPYFYYSGIEICRDGNTYTADTLIELKRRHPEDLLYFIVGADSLDYMDQWYHPEQIFTNAVILTAMRNTQSMEDVNDKIIALKNTYPDAKICRMHGTQIDISSTEIRKRIQSGQSIAGLVPNLVADYIQKNHLYTKIR